jgi:hypothetical protein
MSRLFQHGRDLERSEFKEVKKLLCCLEAAGARTQSAVGAGVQLANTDFMRQFSGMESFRRTPAEEQNRFCSQLSDLELELRGREVGMALGVGLYRIWLTETLAGRSKAAELLGEELTELSRKASVA